MPDLGLDEHTLAILRQRYAPKHDYASDPEAWLHDRLPNAELWSKQLDILHSVAAHPNTAVQAGHGVGKSYCASVVVMWWLDSHPPGSAFVVTTAPSGDQVKGILWKELGRRHAEGGFPGKMNLAEYYSANGELAAVGRKSSDYSPVALQGYHAEFLLVVLDEASGVVPLLWEAAGTLASSEGSRVLAQGNPDVVQSEFATNCASEDWNTIRISVFDSPNFTGEQVSDKLRRVLVSPRWVEERRNKWGEASPKYIARVLGEFPADATDGVIPASWLARAHLLELPEGGEDELGLDVAGGGGDRCVIWHRQGQRAVQRWELVGEKDPLKVADWALEKIQETDAKSIKVDAIGVGWGICGTLDGWHREGIHSCITVPVKVSEAADDAEQFLNKRAEVWWMMRELCRKGEVDLSALSDDDDAELTCVRYHNRNPKQRTQVEKKDDIRKRLGSSPDSADALLLTFYVAQWEPDVSGVYEMLSEKLPRMT